MGNRKQYQHQPTAKQRAPPRTAFPRAILQITSSTNLLMMKSSTRPLPSQWCPMMFPRTTWKTALPTTTGTLAVTVTPHWALPLRGRRTHHLDSFSIRLMNLITETRLVTMTVMMTMMKTTVLRLRLRRRQSLRQLQTRSLWSRSHLPAFNANKITLGGFWRQPNQAARTTRGSVRQSTWTVEKAAILGSLTSLPHLDGKSSFHNGGALFPDGYQKSTKFPGSPWICPVRSCRQAHKTAFSLGDHFKATHKRFMFNDNMDGTLTVVGSYSKRSQPGKCSPVVVSRRPLDPREPPMVEPEEPTGKARFPPVAIQAKFDSESDSLDPEAFVTGDIEDPARPARPSQVVRRGSAQEMWQYIRPFLTNHRDSAPKGNWVQDVIHLPRVRDIKWNEPRIKELPYMDSHPRDITALIIQVTGVEAPTPCTACAQGRGPFSGCVRISPQASQEPRNSVLGCANCYYHCNQSKCSHCSAVVPRRDRQRRERLTDKKTIYNVKVLSDRARGAVRPEKSVQEPQASRTMVDNSVEETSQPRVKIYQPDEIHSLDMASRDRTYKMIWGEQGESISMCGALIPDRYDLDPTVPGRPWVCPIRSCRAVFKKIVGLGSHFAVSYPR